VIHLDDVALERLRESVRAPDLAGTRYQLLGVAGTGGMGTVYVVRDPDLGRRVALKVLDLEDDELGARLRREAQVLARLEHPGVVAVHEVGTLADGRSFYTMKLVDGDRLDRHAARGLTLAERLRLYLRVADTVGFAHAHGVVHRDLKPANIMVGSFGEVLILDWGLAKVTGADADPPLPPRPIGPGATGAGAVLGTPGFMAPEQQAGSSAAVDARADIYSLGAILESLLPPRAPVSLRAIAAKAMAPRPAERYPDVAALARDVTRFLDGERVSALPEGLLRRAQRLAARHRVALGILAAYLVGRSLILLLTRH
jgi:serine/threonine protein kinase